MEDYEDRPWDVHAADGIDEEVIKFYNLKDMHII